MEFLHRLDQTLLLWLNQFAGHSAALDMAVRGIANIYLVKLGLFAAALWWLWFRREETKAGRRLVVDAIAAVVLAVAASILIQAVMPARPRPLHDTGIPFVPPIGQSREALKNWSSFPSDNAALGFALAATFFRASCVWGLLACLWAALVIALPRVYLGLHYPGDVTGGALLGILAAFAVARLLPMGGVYRLVGWTEERWRPWFYSAAFLAIYEMMVLFEDLRRAAGGASKLLHTFVG
ncbi:undecaprenyl-diphosphatase [Azospirillum lipoferum]|uniref:Phosphatase PAP2 family protein n=1 Tax=Azospirillum lipoferum TaxID=193 RepID=A0A5A9GU67_AZOLI|nr:MULTISPECIES: phosphatase PAP2 family protein [Azospirillum]KAA0597926.1 phosphatase PAP2 family protein [Azospirillum lipoferum]MCP1609932.1 undecaprenyl-diphosphatase [Azospirillum lipoferum]MDW5534575.1 phosphatase PAP2 family protein [Azospirillum sp. NL1]